MKKTGIQMFATTPEGEAWAEYWAGALNSNLFDGSKSVYSPSEGTESRIGYTIYFEPKQQIPDTLPEYYLTNYFVQFFGSEKPSFQEIKKAFQDRFSADMSQFGEDDFSWRDDADERVRVLFLYQWKNAGTNENMVTSWSVHTMKVGTYNDLIAGGMPAVEQRLKNTYGNIELGKIYSKLVEMTPVPSTEAENLTVNYETDPTLPKVADGDKAIQNKVLYVALTPDWPYQTAGKNMVLKHDLLNDVIYEIAAELAFMVRDVDIANKPALLLDFKEERPDDFQSMIQLIQKAVIEPLFSATVPEEISLTFPEQYIDWLVYNTDQVRAEIGRKLRSKNNTITLCTEDIFNEYIENGLLQKIKFVLSENPEITTFTVVNTDLGAGPMLINLKKFNINLIYSPYAGNWIQAELGWTHANGVGVPKDVDKAITFYVNAAENGNTFAMYQLGSIYEPNWERRNESFKWFKKAADMGNEYACAYTGRNYYWERGTERNDEEAKLYLEKAAEKNIDGAWYYLSDLYFKQENYDQAFKWCKKVSDKKVYNGLSKASSQHEYRETQYRLGWMYYNGHGVEKDYRMACQHFRAAADRGYNHDDAYAMAADLIAKGYGGSNDDPKLAIEYYERGMKACEFYCNIKFFKYVVSLPEDPELIKKALENLRPHSGEEEATWLRYKYLLEHPQYDTMPISYEEKLSYYESEVSKIVDQYEPAKELLEAIRKEQEAYRLKVEAQENRIRQEKEDEERRAREEREKIEAERAENRRKEAERVAALNKSYEDAYRHYNQTKEASRLINGEKCEMNLEKGIKLLVDSVRGGDPVAKAKLGVVLLQLNPQNKDAFKLLEASTTASTNDFYGRLSSYYEQKCIKAHYLYSDYLSDKAYGRKSARFEDKQNEEKFNKMRGEIPGICFALLASCYLKGLGTSVDIDKGMALLKEARKRVSQFAYAITGFCYNAGLGVVQDLKEAKRYYEMAPDNAIACGNLAFVLAQIDPGRPAEIRMRLKDAANLGNTIGMCNYADVLLGEGNKAAAESWYRKAIIESMGDKEVIKHATKQLKSMGARVPQWEPVDIKVYFENGIPTLSKPANYVEEGAVEKPTPSKPAAEISNDKSDNNSASESIRELKSAFKDVINKAKDEVNQAMDETNKGGFFKRLFGKK